MKPVPITQTPISRMSVTPLGASNLDGLAAQRRFERAVGQTECLSSVVGRDRHRSVGDEGSGESLEFAAIGVGIALEEEVQQRLSRIGLLLRPAPHGG